MGGSIPISPTTLFDEVPALGAFFISGDPKNSWETSHDSVCGDWQNSPEMMLPTRAAKRDLSTICLRWYPKRFNSRRTTRF